MRAALCAVVVAFITGIVGSLAVRPASRVVTANDGPRIGTEVRWRVPVAFGTNLPGLGDNILYVRDQLAAASAGRVRFEVYEPGEVVPVLQITEAVAAGKVQAGYTWVGYDEGRVPSAVLVGAVPFGMEPIEFVAWWLHAGGRELGEKIFAAQGVKPILCGIIGPEAAGWFRNEIEELEDLQGLKIRFAGLGGKVLQRLGASVTMLPGGEIFQALDRGAIDATEYSLPAVDTLLGFDRVVRNKLFPGLAPARHGLPSRGEAGALGFARAGGPGAPRNRLHGRRHEQRGEGRGPAGARAARVRRARHRDARPARAAPPRTRTRGERSARRTSGRRPALRRDSRRAATLPRRLSTLEDARLPPARLLSVSELPPRDPDALPETAISRRIEGALARLEGLASWIWLALLAVIVVNVLARYLFDEGRIEFEELQWHLYAIGFLVGMATGVPADTHVRVDVLRERFSPRVRAWIELYGLLLLLLPFVALVLIYSVPFIASSFAASEVSVSAGGLPFRWAIKSALFAGFALIGLGAFARLLRVASLLFGAPTPLADGAAAAEDR